MSRKNARRVKIKKNETTSKKSHTQPTLPSTEQIGKMTYALVKSIKEESLEKICKDGNNVAGYQRFKALKKIADVCTEDQFNEFVKRGKLPAGAPPVKLSADELGALSGGYEGGAGQFVNDWWWNFAPTLLPFTAGAGASVVFALPDIIPPLLQLADSFQNKMPTALGMTGSPALNADLGANTGVNPGNELRPGLSERWLIT